MMSKSNLFQQPLNLLLRSLRKQTPEMLKHTAIRLFRRAVATAGIPAQQTLRGRQQRPTEAILMAVLIGGVDKVFRDDAAGHLQTSHVAVELRTHVLARETAGGTQLARDQTIILPQRRQDHILDRTFIWHWMSAPAPVAQVRPPRTAHEHGLAAKELAIDTATVAEDGTLPFPQRPLPRPVGEDRVATLLGHQSLGAVACHTAIQQGQEADLLYEGDKLRAGVDGKTLAPGVAIQMHNVKIICLRIHTISSKKEAIQNTQFKIPSAKRKKG